MPRLQEQVAAGGASVSDRQADECKAEALEVTRQQTATLQQRLRAAQVSMAQRLVAIRKDLPKTIKPQG